MLSVISPDDGRDFPLILEHIEDLVDAGERPHIVYCHCKGETFATLCVDIARKSRRLEIEACLRAFNEGPRLGAHLPVGAAQGRGGFKVRHEGE